MTIAQNPLDWESTFAHFLIHNSDMSDAAHDLEHIRRVVNTATMLAHSEGADLAVVLPAAWLHDCVMVPKDSPLRPQASMMAAEKAITFLEHIAYPTNNIDAIYHAIEAHSFSPNILPRTREAQIVRGADRLDAIGAIGIARCLMLGGAMGRRFYDADDPFGETRQLDDNTNVIDHFYSKLLRLADGMMTEAGRAEAQRRTAFMQQFLVQLRVELNL